MKPEKSIQDPLFSNRFARTAVTVAAAMIALALPGQAGPSVATYIYTGNDFNQFSCGPSSPGPGTLQCASPAPGNPNTSYTSADHVTATLTLTSPLGANLTNVDATLLPGFTLTFNDGQQTLSSTSIPAPCCVVASVSTDGSGNIIAPWRVIINVGNAADSGITTINLPAFPSISDSGTLSCCDPAPPGDLAYVFNAPGTWNSGSPNPATQVSNLITAVQGMQIPQQGNSLMGQLQQVLADITAQNGSACQDLNAFANHVRAQTGKKITLGQSNQIMTADTSIATALNCHP